MDWLIEYAKTLSNFEIILLTNVINIFLISFPQNFANVIFLYSFNKRKVGESKLKFWLAMLITWIGIYIVRYLPNVFPMSSILCMVILIVVGVYYLKFQLNKSVLAVFITFIYTLILEVITLSIFTPILGTELTETIMKSKAPTLLFINKCIAAPYSIVFLLTSIVLYFLVNSENCTTFLKTYSQKIKRYFNGSASEKISKFDE